MCGVFEAEMGAEPHEGVPINVSQQKQQILQKEDAGKGCCG